MIERLALVVCLEHPGGRCKDACGPCKWRAKKYIEAMMEPTDKMTQAGASQIDVKWGYADTDGTVAQEMAADSFRAMISTALGHDE